MNIDPRPLYEHEQVITSQELYEMMCSLHDEYYSMPWWALLRKAQAAGAFHTTRILLMWLKSKKTDTTFVTREKP